MGMIDRYKKKGGFVQLLQLIETATPKKQEQFLQIIMSESPPWEAAIRQKMITIHRVYTWPSETLVEIFTRLPQLTLAAALHGNQKELIDGVLKALPPITRRRIEDTMAEVSPSPGEKHSAILRIISDLRGLIHQGVVKLEKLDPELIIAENIEEILNNTPWSSVEKVNAPADALTPSHSAAPSLEKKMGTDGNNSVTNPNESKSAMAEVDFLKRKVNQLISEINSLRTENSVLKEKLDQIKRIA